jgi:tRNA uridine 5-carboxymethylaminomethyl modification enzyme
LKRPELRYDDLKVLDGWKEIPDREVKRQVEIEIKYEGYIKRQLESIEKFKGLENKKIPPGFDYSTVPGLSNELRKKLSSIKPVSIGQAQRISGMTQAALTAVLVYLKKFEKSSDKKARDKQ